MEIRTKGELSQAVNDAIIYVHSRRKELWEPEF